MTSKVLVIESVLDVRRVLQSIMELEMIAGADSGHPWGEMIHALDAEIAKVGRAEVNILPVEPMELLSDVEFIKAWEAYVGETHKHALRQAMEAVLPQVIARHVSRALRYAARTIELYDDATLASDNYLLDAEDAGEILKAMAASAGTFLSVPDVPAEPGIQFSRRGAPTPVKRDSAWRMLNGTVEEAAQQLTKAQREMLINARDKGHAFADIGAKQRAGGAKSRVAETLGKLGLLSARAPYTITENGRAALDVLKM